ncbi:hypothetical protein PROVRETT_05796 [Providencia rettgeri DSM 1131]|uniref:hypothetical protein n=1 Tax=Providencia rettgeri TaxID=587 RepID=UPI000197C46F|nr:hypothetical protein [Providencia rettgeri]EFE55420.1 hypothetical protein PROVRETT_05796 [Providencia rettgeri DSM 1131]MCL0013340.1 hypothetical protein [Providencia rettgeri]QXA56185.1 hypothetical protein I6L79_12180 [Providencia rettgeri]UEK57824.1 hypothetical protein LL668_10840 [Providencia rettgeri]HEM7541150.1 hypothetical protein [Providencia rettgeri]
MTHEEKVKFLFEQTMKAICTRRGENMTHPYIENDFPIIYPVLEKLLNEKLQEK